MPVFTPPFIHIRDKSSQAFHFPGTDIGITVLKEGASYRRVSNPTHEEVTAATIAYLGGRSYPVSDVEAAALTSAGYGAQVTAVGAPIVTPPTDPPQYGLGAYGVGIYGN